MRRFLSGLALALTLLLAVGSSPAFAGIPNPFSSDCKVQGSIAAPDQGAANSIDPGPANPHTGDPFKPGSDTSIYEAYGYSAFTWPSFKCGAIDINISGSAWNGVANMGLNLLGVGIAFVVAITRFAFNPDTLAIFNPILRLGSQALGNDVFKVLFWVTIAATGVLILWKARQARLKESLGGASWLVLVGLLGLVCMSWPLTLAPMFDKGLTHTVGAVNTTLAQTTGDASNDAATGVASNVTRSLLYNTWCAGMVGRSSGPVADKYCPELFKASAISRAEEAKVRQSPDPAQAQQDLVKQKQTKMNSLADELKSKDPTAYDYLVGNQPWDRNANVGLAWLAFGCACLFLTTASLLLLYALIVIRLAILVFPGLAVIGGYPPLRHFVTGLFDYVAAAIIAAVVFGSLTAVFAGMIGAFIGSGLNPALAAVLLLVTTIAAWRLTKPHRQVKNFVRPRFKRKSNGGGSSQGAGNGQAQGSGGQQEEGPSRHSGGSIFTPSYAPGFGASTPAEAKPSMLGSAAKGAATGAASTAVLGLATGGTVTLGAMAAGAAKGAVVSGAGAKFGTVGALGAMAATRGIGGGGSSTQAPTGRHSIGVTAETASASAPTAAAGVTTGPRAALPSGSAPADPKPRVYTPGESHPAENARLVEPTTTASGERVYPIYTPEPKENAR